MLAINPAYAAIVRVLPRQRFIAFAYLFFIAQSGDLRRADARQQPASQLVWVGTRLLHLGLRLQPVRRLGVLGADGGRLQLRTGQAAVRFPRRRRHARRHRRLEPHRFAGHWHRRHLAAARVRRAAADRDPERAPAGAAHLDPAPGGQRARAATAEAPIGGSVLAGITHTLRSPYLLNISLYILLYSITSTFLYFQQAAIVRDYFPDRASRTTFFASVDLAVNVLTLGVQFFVTGRFLRALRRRHHGGGAALLHPGRLRCAGRGADARGLRRRPGAAPSGQLRPGTADPRGALHRGVARGQVQGEERHRHGRLPRRRPGRQAGRTRCSACSAPARSVSRWRPCRSRRSGSATRYGSAGARRRWQ